jgi:ElaB/YqjD/DUF883 family membrane-anchored ribosome-binding protein
MQGARLISPRNPIMENTDKLTTGRDLSRDMSQAAKDTRSDMHSAIDKAAEKVQPTAERLASTAHQTVDKLADTASSVSAKMDERSKQLGAAYQRFAETGRNYVRSSPGVSVLVAVAAGFGLSKLISAASKR